MKILSSNMLILWSLLFYAHDLIDLANSQHVIFESVGQMAGAISYQHAKLTLNLSSIFHQFERYEDSLQVLKRNLSATPAPENPVWAVNSIIKDARRLNLETIQLHIDESEDLSDLVDTLRNILPEVGNPNTMSPQHHRSGRSADFDSIKKKASKIKKYASIISTASKIAGAFSSGVSGVMGLLSLPFGIFGTYMGLYNKEQINLVRKDLYTVINNHNRLVELVQAQEETISTITAQVEALTSALHLTVLQNPGYTSVRLSRIENQIKMRLNIAIHTIQQAQHRRLAVDFLSAEQLDILFIKLNEQAVQNGCQLLISHRSDLFQLETSYFFDGADVHLLLHVPMVPTDSLLRLFKLHPFPLPLSGSHVLVPAVKEDILAISSGFKRYSAQFSATDLLGCHMVNNIYLCERHGVLNSNLNSTCLGSLYMQDFDAVKRFCALEIHRTGEIVHQLLNNWYLVYTPSSQTLPISCFNGTQSEKHISKGTSKIYISPGCRAHLEYHLIISDISVKLETDLLHFEWRWDEVSLEGLDSDTISPQLALLEESGLFRPTLSDLHELNLHQRQSASWWTALVNFVGNLVMLVLFIGLVTFISVRLYRYRKSQKPTAIPQEE